MSNLMNHAETELQYLKEQMPDHLSLEFEDVILHVVEAFADSGQSGFSAPYTARVLSDVIHKLCMFETLTPVTNAREEWALISDDDMLYQNKRCGALFKSLTYKPYYLDAVVFREESGACFTGRVRTRCGDSIHSRQHIKTFPFEPKTFYVDVISGDDGESYIVDDNQLVEVFEYYDKFKIN